MKLKEKITNSQINTNIIEENRLHNHKLPQHVNTQNIIQYICILSLYWCRPSQKFLNIKIITGFI